jgi:hypothetical protein
MKNLILAILLIISSLSAFSQQFTDIDSKSIRVPRYADLAAISSAVPPQVGMMVYNNFTQSYWFYTTNGWTNISAAVSGSPWIINGNFINYPTNGGVGIGAPYSFGSFPSFTLDVMGNARVVNTTTISSIARLALEGSLGSMLSLYRSGLKWNIGLVSGTDDYKIVEVSGQPSERFTIKSSTGFTGINVSNPLFRLDIDGRIRIRSNTYSAGLWFNDNTNSAQNTFLGIDPNNNFGIFSSALNANIFTAKMSNGYIGIGTETPNAPLQFANTGANRKIVLYETGNNDHQFYGMGINAGVLRYQVEQSASDHVFYAGAGTSTSNELFRIKGTGKVGIGTATPKSSLEVNGTLATKLIITNFNSTLDETASVWIFTQSVNVTFPDASTCENRRYVIVNRGNNLMNVNNSSYINFSGYNTYSIPANSSIEIISDGTNWHQIK